MGRATLHRHFPSRSELIRRLAIDALDATDAATADLLDEPTALAALTKMFEALLPLADPFHFLSRCPIDDPEVERRYAGQVAQLGALVEALVREGALATDVPPAWAVAQIDALIWTMGSAVSRGEVAPNSAAELAVRTLIHGLGGSDA